MCRWLMAAVLGVAVVSTVGCKSSGGGGGAGEARDGGGTAKTGAASVVRPVDRKTNPWFDAAESGNDAALKAAAAGGADVNAKERKYGYTPLHLAAINGHVEAVRFILEKGGRASATDENGRTALFLACHHAKGPAALELIKGGTDLEIRDRIQQVALHYAAIKGQVEVVEAMIAKKVKVDAQRKDGSTALHLAAREGYAGVVRALKGAGANLTIRDSRGKTAADLAEQKNRTEIVQLLRG